MRDTQPPLEYLAECSVKSLESFELSRWNRASNLRKELSQVVEEWVQVEVSSRLARWIVERRNVRAGPPHSSRPQDATHSRGDQSDSRLSSLPGASDKNRASLHARSKTVRDCIIPSELRSARGRSLSRRKALERKALLPVATEIAVSRPALPSGVDRHHENNCRRHAALSVRALKELQALDAFASGPPEMHHVSSHIYATPPALLRIRKRRPVIEIHASSTINRQLKVGSLVPHPGLATTRASRVSSKSEESGPRLVSAR